MLALVERAVVGDEEIGLRITAAIFSYDARAWESLCGLIRICMHIDRHIDG